MKKCIICNKVQILDNFYNHKGMTDGKLNKCKSCCKIQNKLRLDNLKLNTDWLEKEKERSREKYHRLNYKDKFKPTYEQKKIQISKYKEKYPEKINAWIKLSKIKVENGYNNHHWSYNEEDIFDTIKLSIEDHNLIHRYLIYDKETFYYKSLENVLLDSKKKHLDYIQNILK